jgi:hypothetical protein
MSFIWNPSVGLTRQKRQKTFPIAARLTIGSGTWQKMERVQSGIFVPQNVGTNGEQSAGNPAVLKQSRD